MDLAKDSIIRTLDSDVGIPLFHNECEVNISVE